MTTIRVGVLVPPSNPTVEPELHRLLPPSVFPYVARFRAEGDLAARLDGYRRDDDAVAGLAGLGLAGALVACTGSSYPIGPDGDRRWAAALTQGLGSPAVTAAGALLSVLEALRVQRISLVSPYPQWLTDQSVAFWQQAGLEVTRVWPVGDSGGIYDTAPDRIAAVVGSAVEAADGATQLVLVTGTGAPSLMALEAAAGRDGPPVLSSNLAGAWALCQLVGANPGESASPALRGLARRIESAS